MTSDQKTRLLIGSLAAAVTIAVAYGVFQAAADSPQPVVVQPAGPVSSPAPSPEPAPGLPVMRLQADGPVTANTSGHAASVTADSDLAYEWSIQGGTIDGSASGPSITWTAGAGAETVLTCKGTNAADKTSTVTVKVLLRQPPTIARFESNQTVITVGSSVKLSWTAKDTQKLVLEPGGRDVTKYDGPALELKPEHTMTYTLTATNSTGVATARELQVRVVPPPEIIAFRAEPLAGYGNSFTIIGEFKAGKAELKNGSQTVISSESSPLRIQLPEMKEGSVLLLTVTNEAGAYVASTLNFSQKKP